MLDESTEWPIYMPSASYIMVLGDALPFDLRRKIISGTLRTSYRARLFRCAVAFVKFAAKANERLVWILWRIEIAFGHP